MTASSSLNNSLRSADGSRHSTSMMANICGYLGTGLGEFRYIRRDRRIKLHSTKFNHIDIVKSLDSNHLGLFVVNPVLYLNRNTITA